MEQEGYQTETVMLARSHKVPSRCKEQKRCTRS